MTKSKRDITLGEMQDECKGHIFCSECKYVKVCTYDRQVSMNEIDLTDPPRFNEAQKAFLRGWLALGAVEAHKCTIEGEGDPFDVIDFYDSDGCCIATVSRLDWLEEQIEFGVDMELHDAVEDVPCAK